MTKLEKLKSSANLEIELRQEIGNVKGNRIENGIESVNESGNESGNENVNVRENEKGTESERKNGKSGEIVKNETKGIVLKETEEKGQSTKIFTSNGTLKV